MQHRRGIMWAMVFGMVFAGLICCCRQAQTPVRDTRSQSHKHKSGMVFAKSSTEVPELGALRTSLPVIPTSLKFASRNTHFFQAQLP